MSKNTTILSLHRNMFTREKLPLYAFGSTQVNLFAYASGVEAVEVKIGDASYIWLPFLGNQLWDWTIAGVSQKFDGFVPEPAYHKDFLENYGGFLIHCGLTAMGNPTKDDEHIQHGELPIADFDKAWLEIDPNAESFPILLCGEKIFHIPFVASYVFKPKLSLHSSGHFAIMDGEVTNMAKTVFPYMYLAHINFAYPKHGSLEYGIKKVDAKSVEILDEVIDGVTANPALMLKLDKATVYDPELVAIMNHAKDAPSTLENPNHMLNTMYTADGSMYWVAFDTNPLDHTVVWLTQTPDRSACGFTLPATGGPTGLTSETKRGTIKYLDPGKKVHLRYAFGYSQDNSTKDAVNACKYFT